MAYENVVSKRRSPQPSELSRQTGKGCGLLLRQTGAQRHCCCQRSTEGCPDVTRHSHRSHLREPHRWLLAIAKQAEIWYTILGSQ